MMKCARTESSLDGVDLFGAPRYIYTVSTDIQVKSRRSIESEEEICVQSRRVQRWTQVSACLFSIWLGGPLRTQALSL